MFKVNNRNTRKRCVTCSVLTTKTPERRQQRHSSDLLLTLNILYTFFSITIVDFEQVNVNWESLKYR